MIERLGISQIIDEVTGSRRVDAAAPADTYLALATLNRVVAPCSKLAFADWWATTAAGRWVKVPAAALDHRRFWDAMDLSTLAGIQETVMIYPSAGGRPKARRMLTDRDPIQQRLFDLLGLAAYAPRA